MKYRFAYCLALVGVLMAGPPARAADPADDLAGAFQAAFGQAPPLEGNAGEPARAADHPDPAAAAQPNRNRLTPIRLVRLRGLRYALVVTESLLDAGHAAPGAIGIAYVTRTGHGWAAARVWSKLASIGNFGEPADHTDVARFGRDPLLLTYSRYCGMGGCWTGVSVFALGQAAPRYLGTVSGDAGWTASDAGEAAAAGCTAYRTMLRVGPPVSGRDVLALSYSGWIKRTGRDGGATWFSGKTDAAATATGLAYSPSVKLPGVNAGGLPGAGCN